MKKTFFFILLVIFFILGASALLFLLLNQTLKNNQNLVKKIETPNINSSGQVVNLNNTNQIKIPNNTQTSNPAVKTVNSVILAVPYINESPDGNWTGYWKNACEEASIAMVENFYLGKQTVSTKDAMDFMNNLFTIENKIFGSNTNTDAKQTVQLINDYSSYKAVIKEAPTVEDIKSELQQNRPVIVPLYGFDLHNKNIPFVPAPRGTSYHMIVIIGYDDTTKEFITNDDGDNKQGASHHYGYDLLMNAIHDWSYVTKQADGPAKAIFTYPKNS
ncbi:MAG: C39 family peptidase [Patescibacteria group bacterium]